MPQFIPLLVAAFLFGCQGVPVQAKPYLYNIPVGTRLVLEQPLQIPLGSASVYIQGGATPTYWALDQYYPHCLFLVATVAETPRTVPPQTFTVTRAVYGEEVFSQLPIHVAGLSIHVGSDGAQTVYLFQTRLYLQSDTYPDVMYIECAQAADYALGDHLTVAEAQAALAGMFRIESQSSQ